VKTGIQEKAKEKYHDQKNINWMGDHSLFCCQHPADDHQKSVADGRIELPMVRK
jgi:hypothetical protein